MDGHVISIQGHLSPPGSNWALAHNNNGSGLDSVTSLVATKLTNHRIRRTSLEYNQPAPPPPASAQCHNVGLNGFHYTFIKFVLQENKTEIGRRIGPSGARTCARKPGGSH